MPVLQFFLGHAFLPRRWSFLFSSLWWRTTTTPPLYKEGGLSAAAAIYKNGQSCPPCPDLSAALVILHTLILSARQKRSKKRLELTDQTDAAARQDDEIRPASAGFPLDA